MRWWRWCWAPVLGLLAACGGGGGAAGGGDDAGGGGGGGGTGRSATAADRYLPLDANARWYYQVDGGTQRLLAAALGPRSVDGASGMQLNVANPLALGAEVVTYVATADAVREYPEDEGDPLLAAMAGIETVRWPARAGDSHVQLDRTLDAGTDFDGDGRPDRVAVLATQRVLGFEPQTVPAGRFEDTLHLQQDLRLTLLPSSGVAPLTVRLVTDQWLARGVGPVRIERVLDDAGSRTLSTMALVAWRAGDASSHPAAPTLRASAPARSPARSATLELSATFDAPMDIRTLLGGTFGLTAEDGRPVAGEVEVLDAQVRFVPAVPLASGRYTAQIGVDARDVLGQALAAPVSWRFEVDADAPGVVQQWPPVDAVDVPLDSTVRVRFSEPLDPASLDPTQILLTQAGLPLPITRRIEGGTDLVIVPQAPLPRGQQLSLWVGGLTDLVGNPVLGNQGHSSSLTTVQGQFAQPAALFPGYFTAQVSLADLDGDGRTELMTVSEVLDPGSVVWRWRLLSRQRAADGSLGPVVERALDIPSACPSPRLQVADLDADGRPDLLVRDLCRTTWLRQGADGQFTPGAAAPGSPSQPPGLWDLDGRGRPTLVSVEFPGTQIVLQRLDGQGQWQRIGEAALAHPAAGPLTAADLDGDGRLDLIVPVGNASSTLDIAVLRQRADGSFAAPELLALGQRWFLLTVAVGDIDGDGRADIVLALDDPVAPQLGWMRQTAAGGFAALQTRRSPLAARQLRVADLDRDGRVDVVIGHGGSGGASVFLQRADGSLGEPVTYRAPYGGFDPDELQLGDVDGDGWIDILAQGHWLRQFPPPVQAPLGRWYRSPAAARR